MISFFPYDALTYHARSVSTGFSSAYSAGYGGRSHTWVPSAHLRVTILNYCIEQKKKLKVKQRSTQLLRESYRQWSYFLVPDDKGTVPGAGKKRTTSGFCCSKQPLNGKAQPPQQRHTANLQRPAFDWIKPEINFRARNYRIINTF